MPYGPKPMPRCREITILCRMDGHTRQSSFKVWERNGVSGQDAPRNTLYDGASWEQAYAAMTAATEVIEEGLRG
jgi:hypothetical protein